MASGAQGSVELAIKGVLVRLKSSSEGVSKSNLESYFPSTTIFQSSKEIPVENRKAIPNPYRCSKHFVTEAVDSLIACGAIEYAANGRNSRRLIINDRGEALLDKLKEGMAFDDAIMHEDVSLVPVNVNLKISRNTGEKNIPLSKVEQVLVATLGNTPQVAQILEALTGAGKLADR